MSLILTDSNGDSITIHASLPESLNKYGINDANTFYSVGDYGLLVFQEIPGRNFSIWYCEYLMRKRVSLYGIADEDTVGLHFTLKGEQVCTLEGLGKVTIGAWQYNLTYLPYIKNKAEFKQGNITTFNIHISLDYLYRLLPYFPSLEEFVRFVEQKKAHSLGTQHGIATPEMIDIINRILTCEYAGAMKALYLEHKVQELLILSLSSINSRVYNPDDISLSAEDVDRLHEARRLLLQNMEEPCSLRELARKVYINEFKLKKGFRKLFGNSVFAFLSDARMEKARQLLMETNIKIKEVAMMTGYKSIPYFTAAFKKKFGYLPSSLKTISGLLSLAYH